MLLASKLAVCRLANRSNHHFLWGHSSRLRFEITQIHTLAKCLKCTTCGKWWYVQGHSIGLQPCQQSTFEFQKERQTGDATVPVELLVVTGFWRWKYEWNKLFYPQFYSILVDSRQVFCFWPNSSFTETVWGLLFSDHKLHSFLTLSWFSYILVQKVCICFQIIFPN